MRIRRFSMKVTITTFFLLFFLGSVNALSQARTATCRITPLWVTDIVRSSYSEDLGSFQIDGSEGKTLRTFKFEENLIVTAGVNFVYNYTKSPKKDPYPFEVQLAVTVSDKEEKEVFESVNSSEASTIYKKNWNLTVTKNINYDDKIYMITLSCADGLKMPRRK